MSEIISFKEAQKKLGKRSKSKSQSKQNTQSEKHGQTPTDKMSDEEQQALEAIYNVVSQARIQPFHVASEFAQNHAQAISILASDGTISTKLADGNFIDLWMITRKGIEWLEQVEDDNSTRH